MKLMKRILLCTLIATFVGACSPPSDNGEKQKVIRVAFWGTPDEVAIIKGTLNVWETANPETKVILEHSPATSYVEKLLTQVAGGAGPDIIFAEVNVFVPFYTKNVLADLSPFLANDNTFNLDEFFPAVVSRFRRNNGVFCIPRDTAPFGCVYYNKTLLDTAGVPYPTDDWDWNDLLTKAKALTVREGDRIKQYGFSIPPWMGWQNFVYSNGGRLVDSVENPTTCLLDQPAAVEGIQFYYDLMYTHKVAPSPTAISGSGMSDYEMFPAQRVAMFASGIWHTPAFREIDNFDWDVVMFPKGSKGTRAFGTGGSGYAMSKTTKHPKIAWEVLKALAGESAQIQLAESGLAQPSIRRIAEGEHWASSPKLPLNKKMLNKAVNYAIYEPFHTRWPEINRQVITQQLELLWNGRQNVGEACTNIAQKATTLLQTKH